MEYGNYIQVVSIPNNLVIAIYNGLHTIPGPHSGPTFQLDNHVPHSSGESSLVIRDIHLVALSELVVSLAIQLLSS